MRVMVTGSQGFIGKAVTRKLRDLQHDICGIDTKMGTDILDDLSKPFEIFKPEIVIHMACTPIAKYCNEYRKDAVSTIVGGTQNILETIKDHPVKRFVYISSSMVYGDFVNIPEKESDPKNPKCIYGAAKLSAELLTKVYGRMFGIDYIIVRPSAVYGPGDVNRRVSQIFLENAIERKPIVIKGGEDTRLDFTYVEDIADGIILAAFFKDWEKPLYDRTFNITAGNGRSLIEYVDILRNYFPDIKVVNEPRDESIPKRGTLDISKAREILGYSPKFSLEDGIRKYVESK
jgi:nucleoside-diphosphate-sugar epimerase